MSILIFDMIKKTIKTGSCTQESDQDLEGNQAINRTGQAIYSASRLLIAQNTHLLGISPAQPVGHPGMEPNSHGPGL